MKSFNDIYEEVYKESNEELEALRKSKARKSLIFIIIAVVVLVAMVSPILGNTKHSTFHFTVFQIMFPLVIVMMIIIIVTALNKTKFTATFKEKVIAPFIKNIDENLNYYPNKGIASTIYRQGEFEHYDIYSSEDAIEGILDGKYAVRIAEVHTQDESTDSDGDRHTYTLFHGIFGNVECSKNIGTTLKIHSDKGFLGNLFKGKQRVEMDSAEFEKHFDVYGDNKIIAMQILTSDVMAMMIDFRNESKIKYELTIKNNQMYIRFHTGEVFEPQLFKSALDYDMLKKYYDIIDFVFRVSRAINKAIENTEI